MSDSDNNNDPIGTNNNNDPGGQSEPQNSGNIDKDKKDEERSSPEQNQQSIPERWILVLAIAILAFGVILLTLRSVVFSLILVTTGISLFAYWLYLEVRSREQARSLSGYVSNSTFRRGELVCTCSICKHSESKSCMQKRCPCCILTRNKEIIGHFSNPLQ